MNMELQQRTKYTLASASILQVRGGGVERGGGQIHVLMKPINLLTV